MTTGGSVVEMLDAVRRTGAEVVGVACLVDRGGLKSAAGVRTAAVLKLDLPTYKPEECPLCREGTPLQKPGMKGVSK